MTLLIKNLNESLLRKVEPELAASVVQEPIRHASTEIKKSEKKTKNRQIEETSCSSSANTSEEISNRKLKNRKQKNDSGSSGQKDKNVLKKLEADLVEARCDLQSMSEWKVRLANFSAVIETQNLTIDELRAEVQRLKSKQNLITDQGSNAAKTFTALKLQLLKIMSCE